jgi:adenosylhomocysteine nucleosidase
MVKWWICECFKPKTKVKMIFRKLSTVILIWMLLCFTGCFSSAEICIPYVDETPLLAVLTAYEPELKALLKEASIENTYIINGRGYHVGQLAGNEVVLVMTGISMVNAAMTTQTALDHFNVQGIILSGIAGGVNPNLNIGDVTIPEQWGQYQEQLFARETDEGWELGWYSDEFSNYGMMFPQKVSVTRKGNSPNAEEELFWFHVDSEMLSAVGDVAVNIQLNKCTSQGKCLDTEPVVLIGGNGVSGQTFVDNARYRDWVWTTFQANALDMETAAVAHVAYVNAVPFIAFRSLSDLAGGGSGVNEIDTFFQLAADNSAQVVIAFLEMWRDH